MYRDIICEAQVQSQEQFMEVGVRVEDSENGASADPWGHRRQVSWVRRLYYRAKILLWYMGW